jgi:hypothetical protein
VTTHQIIIIPSAIAVGLPGEHVALVHEVFGERGLKVHAYADPAVATELITKTLPQLVVASADLAPEHRARVEDATVAVGAVFVLLANVADYVAIERQLESAYAVARERFGKSRSR